MAYDIVFVEEPEVGRDPASASDHQDRGTGTVFLSQLPRDPKVFAFFFPGSADTEELQRRLRALGEKTGDNLYVDMGSLLDPDYLAARERFKLGPLPAVIVTATSPLAATPTGESAFVRLDGISLFAQPEKLVRTVEELFNLFLGGQIAQAVRLGWTVQSAAALAAAAERVWSIIQPVITWLGTRDYSFDLLSGKIEVKESRGRQ
jgi:hypothetical protein